MKRNVSFYFRIVIFANTKRTKQNKSKINHHNSLFKRALLVGWSLYFERKYPKDTRKKDAKCEMF